MTNFPNSIDTYVNPQPTDDEVLVPHAAQHQNHNDSVIALETKVGSNNSTVQTSHDFKLSEVATGDKAVSKTATQTLTNKTLTAPTITGGTSTSQTLTTPTVNVGADATGDIYARSSGGGLTRIPNGSLGQVLTATGAGVVPSFQTPTTATAQQIQDQSFVYAATSTGTDSYAITLTPAPASYVIGQRFVFRADVANTGACSLNVNGLGARTIVKGISTGLSDGDISANQIVDVIYDGTNLVMQSLVAGAVNGATYAVNADEALMAYNTIQLPFAPTSATVMPGWTVAGVSPLGFNGAASYLALAGTVNSIVSTLIVGSGSTDNYSPAQNKIIRYRQTLRTSDTSDKRGWGFCITATDIYNAETSTTDGQIRFVLNGGNLFAQNSNGSASTSTNITSGITVTNWNTYEIVLTPGVDIKFYVNGTLRATHTTNLPTAGTLLLAMGSDLNGRRIDMLPPIISIHA